MTDFVHETAHAIDLEAAIARYRADGVAPLGRVVSDEGLVQIRARADAIMLGEVVHEGLFFQHDAPTGRYEDLVLGQGWVGPSLQYRKIEKLERDPVFLAWIDNALFGRIAHALIEDDVVLYRAVLFTKGSDGGTDQPWHQDGGNFWGLDRDPYLQIWTALDDAPVESGCMEAVLGTHAHGLATPLGGVVPDDVFARTFPGTTARDRLALLPAKAGEAYLLHNHAWHRSARNTTKRPRRALTICVMSAATKCLRKKRAPRVFWPLYR